jgi:3-hydroxyacyl-[acyl-carrier-protein] dehydratase
MEEIKNDIESGMMISEILKYLPHRHPFLLIDRIIKIDKTNSAAGYKNISNNEPYLKRNSAQKLIFPETLIIESMSQIGAVAILSRPIYKGKIMLFAGIDEFKIYRQVFPGDSLVTQVQQVYLKNNLGKMKAVSKVQEELAAEGFLSFAIADSV